MMKMKCSKKSKESFFKWERVNDQRADTRSPTARIGPRTQPWHRAFFSYSHLYNLNDSETENEFLSHPSPRK